MKKIFLILAITVMAFAMTGCLNDTKTNKEATKTPQTNEPSTTKKVNSNTSNDLKAYTEILAKYTKAVKEKWTGDDLSLNEMSLMMLDCYGNNPQKNIGYIYLDLDNDNIKELIFATTDVITDEFYGKLIFDVYTLNEKGTPIKVLTSSDRDRYYYAGENKFANIGSSSAGSSIETTVKMEKGKLVDLKQPTPATDYEQLELTLMK